jgi:hypothetical protein
MVVSVQPGVLLAVQQVPAPAQSSGQLAMVSPPSHAPLPQHGPQSAGQLVQVSPPLHVPSPQHPGAMTKTQPTAGSHESSVHGSPSLHATAAPGWHVPPTHRSPLVHALPSLHGFEFGVFVQPCAGTQASVVHRFASLQSGGGPPTQDDPAQASPTVQALPSEQATVFGKLWQPAAGAQKSSVHGLPSEQSTGVPGWQSPPEHLSFSVQRLPSLHELAFGALTHPTNGSQESVVQTLPSLQSGAGPPMQAPPWHESAVVHALPSEQGAVVGGFWQPSVGLQKSKVQGLPSEQSDCGPGRQSPSLHASPTVHGLPSLHGAELNGCWQPTPETHASSVQALPSLHTSGEPA